MLAKRIKWPLKSNLAANFSDARPIVSFNACQYCTCTCSVPHRCNVALLIAIVQCWKWCTVVLKEEGKCIDVAKQIADRQSAQQLKTRKHTQQKYLAVVGLKQRCGISTLPPQWKRLDCRNVHRCIYIGDIFALKKQVFTVLTLCLHVLV